MNREYDAYRTKRLKSIGVKRVLRFKNEEVFDKEKVEQHLKFALNLCKNSKNGKKVKTPKNH